MVVVKKALSGQVVGRGSGIRVLQKLALIFCYFFIKKKVNELSKIEKKKVFSG